MNTAFMIAVAAFLVVQIVLILLGFRILKNIYFEVRGEYDHFAAELRSFVSAPDEKTPSPLAQTIDAASKVAGRALAMELKATLMGKASGDARSEQAALAGMVQDEMSAGGPQGQIINGVLSLFGKRGQNALLKNPALMQFILQKMSGSQAGGNGNGHHSEASGFGMKKF